MTDHTIAEEVRRLATQLAASHPGDAQEAIRQAILEIQQLPDYEDFVDALVRAAIGQLVYDARHRANVAARRHAGQEPAKQRAGPQDSQLLPAISRASLFNYSIRGGCLGDLKGGNLLAIAQDCEAKARGYLFDANLCRKLHTLVKADQRVRDAITEARLVKIFVSLGRAQEAAPPEAA